MYTFHCVELEMLIKQRDWQIELMIKFSLNGKTNLLTFEIMIAYDLWNNQQFFFQVIKIRAIYILKSIY